MFVQFIQMKNGVSQLRWSTDFSFPSNMTLFNFNFNFNLNFNFNVNLFFYFYF